MRGLLTFLPSFHVVHGFLQRKYKELFNAWRNTGLHRAFQEGAPDRVRSADLKGTCDCPQQ